MLLHELLKKTSSKFFLFCIIKWCTLKDQLLRFVHIDDHFSFIPNEFVYAFIAKNQHGKCFQFSVVIVRQEISLAFKFQKMQRHQTATVLIISGFLIGVKGTIHYADSYAVLRTDEPTAATLWVLRIDQLVACSILPYRKNGIGPQRTFISVLGYDVA